MPTPRRVTCVLINHTTSNVVATGDTLNYKITQGTLLGAMPCPIGGKGQVSFTLVQADGAAVGPSGWACYELEFHALVYQIGFGDPAQGAQVFTIGANYLDKQGDAITSVSFRGPSGPIEPAQVAGELDLTVEYHLDFKPILQVAADPTVPAQASQSVAATPGGSANVVIPPFIARWDDPRMTQKRKKLLASVFKLYPMLWQDLKADPKAVAPENGGGTYINQGTWTDANPADVKGKPPGPRVPRPGTSCTSSIAAIAGAVATKSKYTWNFAAYQAKSGWTPWGSDPTKRMPSVGDIYLLYRDEITTPPPGASVNQKAQCDPHLRHVGIVMQVPTSASEIFITADGGQRAHTLQAAHLAKRGWKVRKPGPSDASREKDWNKKVHPFAKPIPELDYAYFVGGAESKDPMDGNRLLGWIDVDLCEFDNEAFDKTYTQADYEAMGARIDSMK